MSRKLFISALFYLVMDEKHQRGFADYKPYYVVDEETGEIIPVYLTADAVMPEARAGAKAGNPLLDEINEQLKRDRIIEKMRGLHRKRSK